LTDVCSYENIWWACPVIIKVCGHIDWSNNHVCWLGTENCGLL